MAALTPMTVVSVDGPGPSVWLTSLDVPGRTPFAQPGYATDPVLPRVVRPLPPLPDRDPPAAYEGEARVIQASAQPHRAAPGPDSTLEPAAPGLAAALSEALRRQARQPIAAPDITPDAASPAIARLAPRRSPMPPSRPAGIVPVAETLVAEAAPAELPVLALAASRLPLRRPDTVARLASLDMSAPAPALTPETPERRADPAPLPALGRALAPADQCESRLTRAIPRRGRAQDGSAVIAQLASAHGRNRDDALIAELAQGNMPDFLRDLVPVTFAGTGPDGQATRVTICVMPDYLAVGSDRDFVRVPLGLPAAMRIAERFDMVLPTTTMVDAIYTQASVRLAPSPMTPGPQMETTGYFRQHNATVQQQMARAGGRLGQLVSGHKKDLVLTNRLERNPGRVAIYGWHRTNGRPIQPLSTVHGAQYADYSHGIRLVARTAYVNGRAVDLRDLLADSRYAGLVSNEGPITNRTLLAALR